MLHDRKMASSSGVFLDSFQGYYKDGTDGTCDCHCFLSLYLLTRIALFVVYGFIKNVYFYPFASLLLHFLVAMIVFVQLFKPQFGVYNTIHTLLFLNLAIYVVCDFSLMKTPHLERLSLTLPCCSHSSHTLCNLPSIKMDLFTQDTAEVP